ncbi:uncharacterized protein LOC124410654 isoform X2 [Diprion similis]|nr:uncharacterized protein LOC124410654 isoform X2 [Diprion similis]
MRYDILLPVERVERRHHTVENHYKFERAKVIERDHFHDQYVNLKICGAEETTEYVNNGRITFFQCLNRTPRIAKISMHVIQGGLGTPELVVKVTYTPVQFLVRSMLNITCHIRTENMYDGTVGEKLLLNLSGVQETRTLLAPVVLGREMKEAKESTDHRSVTEASTGYTVKLNESSSNTGKLVTSSSIEATSLRAHKMTVHAKSFGELNVDTLGTDKTKFRTTGASLSTSSTDNNDRKSTLTPSTINLNCVTCEEPAKSIIPNGEVHMSTGKMTTTNTNRKLTTDIRNFVGSSMISSHIGAKSQNTHTTAHTTVTNPLTMNMYGRTTLGTEKLKMHAKGMSVKSITEDPKCGTLNDEIISSLGTSQRPGKPRSKLKYSNKTEKKEKPTREHDLTTVPDEGIVLELDETTCSGETCMINAMGEKTTASTSTATQLLISTRTVELSLQKSQTSPTSPTIEKITREAKIDGSKLRYKIMKVVTSPWFNSAIKAVPKDMKKKISLAKITY